MSGYQVVCLLGRTVGRQSVVMVGGADSACTAVGFAGAWRALGGVVSSGWVLGEGFGEKDGTAYSRIALSSALRTVGSGAASSEREGIVAAGCRSAARLEAAA